MTINSSEFSNNQKFPKVPLDFKKNFIINFETGKQNERKIYSFHLMRAIFHDKN